MMNSGIKDFSIRTEVCLEDAVQCLTYYNVKSWQAAAYAFLVLCVRVTAMRRGSDKDDE